MVWATHLTPGPSLPLTGLARSRAGVFAHVRRRSRPGPHRLSTLGSGFLSGTVTGLNNGDFRQHNPRFAGENLAANRDRFMPFMAIARELGITPAQLALAWLLHQGLDIFAILGARRAARVEENARAADIHLTPALLQRISDLARPGLAEGATLV
jgi:aryl-alcohol dehydrogenase-like predicted oxidoreductase